jgi:hypothetical protein
MRRRETAKSSVVSLISNLLFSLPAHALKNPLKMMREALPF